MDYIQIVSGIIQIGLVIIAVCLVVFLYFYHRQTEKLKKEIQNKNKQELSQRCR